MMAPLAQSPAQDARASDDRQRRNNLRLAWVLAAGVLSIFVVTLCTLRLN